MTRTVYRRVLTVIFDPTHKGAPYSLDGIHWFNHGDLVEIEDKAVKGFAAEKDGNGKWNKCSDIEETATSIKSGGATLANDLRSENGEDMDEMLDRYFTEVHSTNWDFGFIVDDEIIIYNMNAEEFREAVKTWAGINERKVIRFKKESSKMIKWFEERVA